MKTFLLKNLIFLAGCLLSLQSASAQKKLLILGSSTSTCFFGPSSVDSCYVTKLQRYYQSIGSPFTLDNRAVAGDNVYYGMPLNFTPPPLRNSPRPFDNITEGLAGNPDVVLINYPSNGYDIYTVEEVMTCLRIIKQTANAAGKPCYVTTSQPRNSPDSFKTDSVRIKMATIKDRVLAEFGAYAIDFWNGLANPDNSLMDMYQVDGIHINNAGHQILFSRVLDKNIFGLTPPGGGGPGLTYKYYEGDWNSVPDFTALQPVKSGSVRNVDIGPRSKENYFGFLWQGYINIPTAGNYTFELLSDDGSKLYFNTLYGANATALVNDDGLHAPQSASNTINISNAGSYPLSIAYFQKTGGESIQVYWTGPGFSRQLIPDAAFTIASTSTGSGLTYKYYEGIWNTLPDFNALTPVKSGSIANVDMSPRNRTDYYGFLWQGNISIPTSGNYTFELVSDDGSKLYFNSPYNASATAFVSNDGVHAATSASNSTYINAGSYPIAIAYFEKDGGESIQVYWTGPGIARQLIPNSAFTRQASSSVSGLTYKYYEGDWNALPDFNALTPVKSGSIANVDMSPRNKTDYYGFVWQGNINIPTSGNYTFELVSDDGSKLYFNALYNANATAFVSDDGLHAPTSASNSSYINAGSYPFAVAYFEKNGGESIQVYWTGPGIPRQLIPNAAFTSTAAFSSTTTIANQAPNVINTLKAEVDNSVNAYPNPFNQTLTINYYNTSTSNNISAGLYDLSGKLLQTQYFKNIPAGSNTLKINMKQHQNMPVGMYVLKIAVNGIPYKVLKLVKSRS